MTSLTARQERFCHAFVNYANAADAARVAGYAPASARKQGSRLLSDDRIIARIEEIQAALGRNYARRREALVGKLEVVYRRALQDHQFYSAARAVELQGRLVGFAGGVSKKSDRETPAESPKPAAAKAPRLISAAENVDICGHM